MSRQSLRGLDCINFFLADVQAGVGPFLAIYQPARWLMAFMSDGVITTQQVINVRRQRAPLAPRSLGRNPLLLLAVAKLKRIQLPDPRSVWMRLRLESARRTTRCLNLWKTVSCVPAPPVTT